MFKIATLKFLFVLFAYVISTSFSYASSYTDNEIEKEKIRISKNLIVAENSLRQRLKPELSPEQQVNRMTALDFLKEYIDLGQFPKNDQMFTRVPIFKDKEGTWCAVGYMLARTGYQQLAEQINNKNTFIQIDEIDNFEEQPIGEWAKIYGFEQAELSMIQPGYSPPYKLLLSLMSSMSRLYQYSLRYLTRTGSFKKFLR